MKLDAASGANVSNETTEGFVVAPPAKAGSVVDLFCGAGGLTHGLLATGFHIAAGIDMDPQCRYPYEYNNRTRFIQMDVNELTAKELSRCFLDGRPRILVGCAPCQPFSLYNQKNKDPKWRLVQKFGKLVVDTRPDVVSMENVPRLLKYEKGSVFDALRTLLERAGYYVWYDVAVVADYGVPQYRRRLVLMASLHGELSLEVQRTKQDRYQTVEQAIGHLPPIGAGETDPDDRLHTAGRLSPLNLKRIRASMPGGSWEEWEEELRAECHRADTGRGYKSVYGRMKLEEPSPTITTQFFGFGNGRFGHPEQDRALSLREGAILQSFPPHYEFVPPAERVQFKAVGRMIGNAVPFLLGRAIGRSIASHVEKHGLAAASV